MIGHYGYEVIEVGDNPNKNLWLQNPMLIERAMLKTKTMIVIDYKTIGNPLHNRVLKNLDMKVIDFVADNMPCVVCAFSHKSQIIARSMTYCNSFKHFFNITTIPHARRCEVCCEKERKYAHGFRCDKRLCIK